MPREVRAWACSWGCGKHVDTVRSRMAKHETRCFHNPVRRACQTCGSFDTFEDTVYNPDHGGDPGSTDYEVRRRWCEARQYHLTYREADCAQWTEKNEEERKRRRDHAEVS